MSNWPTHLPPLNIGNIGTTREPVTKSPWMTPRDFPSDSLPLVYSKDRLVPREIHKSEFDKNPYPNQGKKRRTPKNKAKKRRTPKTKTRPRSIKDVCRVVVNKKHSKNSLFFQKKQFSLPIYNMKIYHHYMFYPIHLH